MSIDPAVWRAASPTKVRIPAVGSRVYYFPQGHIEHASSEPDFSGVKLTEPYFVCVVSKNQYLADPDTDEVFLKISLLPLPLPPASAPEPPAEDPYAIVLPFSKVLTPSDANNGGGFSVPRFCAESVFPLLDFANSETPVQTLVIRDLLGETWQFRHIYRGTPRRHLLTTGWSKFVNAKKLVAGDTIVFIKDDAGEILVGIRRRPCRVMPFAAVAAGGNAGTFVRDGRGRVAPTAVATAVGAAEAGTRFHVDFYPGKGRAEFVVAEAAVRGAMSVGPTGWAVGTRVRMQAETDEPSRIAWYLGVVSLSLSRYDGPWARSPWRMLQVIWDEPQDAPLANLSPWQVEPIGSPSVLFHIDHTSPSYPVIKRPRQNCSVVPTDNFQGDHHNTTFSNMMADSTSIDNNRSSSSPVGMQGARQGPSNSAFTLYNPTTTHQYLSNIDNLNNYLTEHLPSGNDDVSINVQQPTENGSATPPEVMLFGQNIHQQDSNDATSITTNGGGSPGANFKSIRT